MCKESIFLDQKYYLKYFTEQLSKENMLLIKNIYDFSIKLKIILQL